MGMTKEQVLKKARIGDCCVIFCAGFAQKYLVRFIGEWFLELEYLDKSDGLIDCRIGFRAIQAIEVF